MGKVGFGEGKRKKRREIEKNEKRGEEGKSEKVGRNTEWKMSSEGKGEEGRGALSGNKEAKSPICPLPNSDKTSIIHTCMVTREISKMFRVSPR